MSYTYLTVLKARYYGRPSNQDTACCPGYIHVKKYAKTTSEIRTLRVVPMVSVIERFHRTSKTYTHVHVLNFCMHVVYMLHVQYDGYSSLLCAEVSMYMYMYIYSCLTCLLDVVMPVSVVLSLILFVACECVLHVDINGHVLPVSLSFIDVSIQARFQVTVAVYMYVCTCMHR